MFAIFQISSFDFPFSLNWMRYVLLKLILSISLSTAFCTLPSLNTLHMLFFYTDSSLSLSVYLLDLDQNLLFILGFLILFHCWWLDVGGWWWDAVWVVSSMFWSHFVETLGSKWIPCSWFRIRERQFLVLFLLFNTLFIFFYGYFYILLAKCWWQKFLSNNEVLIW